MPLPGQRCGQHTHTRNPNGENGGAHILAHRLGLAIKWKGAPQRRHSIRSFLMHHRSWCRTEAKHNERAVPKDASSLPLVGERPAESELRGLPGNALYFWRGAGAGNLHSRILLHGDNGFQHQAKEEPVECEERDCPTFFHHRLRNCWPAL